MRSARLEQKHCYLAHVEIDKVLGFMSDIGSKVTTNNTMPGWVIFLVEFFLDVCSNVFLDIEFLESYISTINSILLHFFIHVSMLDHSLTLGT